MNNVTIIPPFEHEKNNMPVRHIVAIYSNNQIQDSITSTENYNEVYFTRKGTYIASLK